MDKTDHKLLQLLHENSRISIVELSKKVNLSRPSVKERINKLVDQGIITNFTIQVSLDKIKQTITFFSELSQVTLSVDAALKLLKENPYVNEVHIVSGDVNYLVKATVTSTTEMKELLAKWMQFATVKSSIILETAVENQLNLDT
ncbi:Lrp/AsnC family transcriptional regulator [Candidatus Enterococcus ikei]|uniref:Lrp/AsnC family transcriptional regulator n=1 Tax=Candidatus Enterococcus ikei TaxID=2815326 RepID=A0ABS3H2S9_9ENTE|nr:Lrp/AsnC family transcriptional regulator [Enterococcus sp. DIV0869a]MBO0441291.1 Lrp/AsnC family transcriptional regulator [Enterococcus sp. DIV0869a]